MYGSLHTFVVNISGHGVAQLEKPLKTKENQDRLLGYWICTMIQQFGSG